MTGWKHPGVLTYMVAVYGGLIISPALLIFGSAIDRWTSVIAGAFWMLISIATFQKMIEQGQSSSAVNGMLERLAMIGKQQEKPD